MRAEVTLFGHRLAAPGATGIGRYITELTIHLASMSDDQMSYRLVSSREHDRPAWKPDDVPLKRLRAQRQALHVAWCVAERPPLERLAGATSLVHVFYPSTPVPARAPTVVMVHDLIPLTNPEWYGRGERWAFRRGIEHAASNAARVLTPSTVVAATLQDRMDIPSDRVTVIPNGVGSEFFAARDHQRIAGACARAGLSPDGYVIALGAIEERKNLMVLVRALSLLGGEAPMLALVGPKRGAEGPLLAEAERLGVAKRIRVTGYVTSDDVALLVAGARALVHPAMDEGFGITPLEAMAAGTPAAVSGAGSLPEVVGGAALIIEPQDVDGWADAMRQLTQDPKLVERLRADGIERSTQYSWRRTAELTRQVHLEVLGHRASPVGGGD